MQAEIDVLKEQCTSLKTTLGEVQEQNAALKDELARPAVDYTLLIENVLVLVVGID